MNCKPGDLALIVRVGPYTTSALGRIVTVISPTKVDGLAAWTYKSDRPIIRDDLKTGVEALEDCCLQPIRGAKKADGNATRREMQA